MRTFPIYLLTTCLAAPVVAEGLPPRPESCQLVSTAQFSDCEVENRYQCKSETSSFYWIEGIEAEGLTAITQETSDFRPVSILYASGEAVFITKVEGSLLRDLIKAGSSTQRHEGHVSIFGLKQPLTIDLEYEAAVKTILLAGKSFDAKDSEIVIGLPNAGITIRGASTIAYQADLDLYIETEFTSNVEEDDTVYLREFALPGQAGFGAEYPKHGCLAVSVLTLQAAGGRI